jgi:hypothetical protein
LGDKQSVSLLHECCFNVNNVLKAVHLPERKYGVILGAHGRLEKETFVFLSKKMVDMK